MPAAKLQSAEGIREHSDEFLVGEVVRGPEIDGADTWQFDGRLNAEGIARLVDEYGDEELPDEAREGLAKVADGTRAVFTVGREDRLPRTIELEVDLSAEDFKGLDGFGNGGSDEDGSFSLDLTVALSDFGKPVSYEAPEGFRAP